MLFQRKLYVFNYFRCEAMERLIQSILEEEENLDGQVFSQLGYSLSVALQKQFEDSVFPTPVNEE